MPSTSPRMKLSPSPEPQSPNIPPRTAARALAKSAALGDLAAAKKALEQHPQAAAASEPILAAAGAGHADVVRCLLEHGADPNLLSDTAHPLRPLHRVIEHKRTIPKTSDHVKVVQALLDGGADVMARGTSANLHVIAIAAMGPEKQFLPLLLPHLDPWDIFTASVLGEDRLVATFLQRDPALARATDVNGMTALHYCAASRLGAHDDAAAHRLARTARLLLDAGADLEASWECADHGDLSPVKFAYGNRAVLEVLLERGADALDGLQAAVSAGDFDAAKWLLDHGADIHYPCVGKLITALTERGHFPHARWVIEHGGDPNGRDSSGRTPLHWAAQRGAKMDFVRFLLDHGANPKTKDKAGETPVQMAAKQKAGLVKLLKGKAAA